VNWQSERLSCNSQGEVHRAISAFDTAFGGYAKPPRSGRCPDSECENFRRRKRYPASFGSCTQRKDPEHWASCSCPQELSVIDGRGKTLIPGLIDAHTHIRSRRDLEQSVVFGVTTDISMLMDLQLATAEKAEQNANKAADRADLLSSGYCATAPSGRQPPWHYFRLARYTSK
jgi:hypothetical protein